MRIAKLYSFPPSVFSVRLPDREPEEWTTKLSFQEKISRPTDFANLHNIPEEFTFDNVFLLSETNFAGNAATKNQN